MRNGLLTTSAAIALLAGAGFATAQDRKEGAAPAPAAQQSAPAEKVAPPTGAEHRSPGSMSPKNAQTESPASKPSTTGQAPTGSRMDDKAAPDSTRGAVDKPERKSSGGKEQTKPSTTGQAPSRENRMDNKAQQSPSTSADTPRSSGEKSDMKSPGRPDNAQSSGTSGQGAAGASGAVNLTGEQRTTIRTVITGDKAIQPLNSVNFSLNVGTRVPRDVRLHPLPARVIEIYPAWRGYEYVLVRDEIIVINPRTLEIVAVIES